METLRFINLFRPLLDEALGDMEWYKIRKASEGFIIGDEEPFKNVNDPKYTF
jgi:hypothetical protein